MKKEIQELREEVKHSTFYERRQDRSASADNSRSPAVA